MNENCKNKPEEKNPSISFRSGFGGWELDLTVYKLLPDSYPNVHALQLRYIQPVDMSGETILKLYEIDFDDLRDFGVRIIELANTCKKKFRTQKQPKKQTDI
jgi:hypothetical protein